MIFQIDLDKIRYWSSHDYGIKKRFFKQIFTPTMALAGTQEYKNAPKKNETRVERERRTMRGDVEF